jgi:hypothetical protein
MTPKSKYLLLVLLSLLCACATVDTFNKRVVVANATIEALATTTSTLLGAGKLEGPDAENVYNQLVQARNGIETIRSLRATVGSQESDKQLSIIIGTLNTINHYLESHQ